MATKKPWRTVLTGTSMGRFTREQIREAMDSVSSKSSAGRTEVRRRTMAPLRVNLKAESYPRSAGLCTLVSKRKARSG
jgi:hypothetical protein